MPGSAACSASTSTISATSPAPISANGRATSSCAMRCARPRASRSCGTRRRRPSASPRRGSPTMSPRRSQPCRAGSRRRLNVQDDFAKQIKKALVHYGIDKEPIGIDMMELPHAARAGGGRHRGGRRPAGAARRARDQDRRRDRAAEAGRVDGRRHLCRHRPRDPPGHASENELVAIANDRLFRMGSERVECVNSVSGRAAGRTRTPSPTA